MVAAARAERAALATAEMALLCCRPQYPQAEPTPHARSTPQTTISCCSLLQSRRASAKPHTTLRSLLRTPIALPKLSCKARLQHNSASRAAIPSSPAAPPAPTSAAFTGRVFHKCSPRVTRISPRRHADSGMGTVCRFTLEVALSAASLSSSVRLCTGTTSDASHSACAHCCNTSGRSSPRLEGRIQNITVSMQLGEVALVTTRARLSTASLQGDKCQVRGQKDGTRSHIDNSPPRRRRAHA